MKLYSIQDKSKLKPVSNIKFDLEKEIQVLFEKNLEELFNLQFVKSELGAIFRKNEGNCSHKFINSYTKFLKYSTV